MTSVGRYCIARDNYFLYAEASDAVRFPSMNKGDLSTSQVAEQIGVSPITVRLWCRRGLFPSAYEQETPRGPVWMIPESDLKGFEAPKKTGRPPKPSAAASGKKVGSVETQTRTTRKLDSSIKREADERMAGKKKGSRK